FSMASEKDVDEIELKDALELVKSNKSVFVWIVGWTNTPLADLLEIDSSKVISANPFVIMDKETYPSELSNYERPIFVCHHGISSFELVKELANENIKGYSLVGGIEAIKSRA
ncbi:MAG: hypothetical protein ACHQX1_03555, partial [Candidatus Micrarchaeales archaeon]